MQAELQFQVWPLFKDAGTNAIDPRDHHIGDGAAVQLLLGGFGKALEVDAIPRKGRIFTFKALDGLVCQAGEEGFVGKVHINFGVPSPGIPPDDPDAQGVRAGHHLSGVKGCVIVPDDDFVQLQAGHVGQVAPVIVNDITPCPQAAAAHLRRMHAVHVLKPLFKGIAEVIGLHPRMGLLCLWHYEIDEIRHAIEHGYVRCPRDFN